MALDTLQSVKKCLIRSYSVKKCFIRSIWCQKCLIHSISCYFQSWCYSLRSAHCEREHVLFPEPCAASSGVDEKVRHDNFFTKMKACFPGDRERARVWLSTPKAPASVPQRQFCSVLFCRRRQRDSLHGRDPPVAQRAATCSSAGIQIFEGETPGLKIAIN